MTIIKRFVLVFTLFTTCLIGIISAISFSFIKSAYTGFDQPTQIAYLQTLIPRMAEKAVITFAVIIMSTALISLPAGLLLYRMIAHRYLALFKRIRTIAHQRLLLMNTSTAPLHERALLETYVDTLMNDLKIVQGYQNMVSWKNGARMLMHELKNPLTPLKLASQKIHLNAQSSLGLRADCESILLAVQDIEKILSYFSNLVSIEFGLCELLDIKDITKQILSDLQRMKQSFEIQYEIDALPTVVIAEKTLIRILITNLVTNGLEANPDGFSVVVRELHDSFCYEFITKDRSIHEQNRIFQLGYSSKGVGRGFGLFLCKRIVDYIGATISYANCPQGVRFDVSIPKVISQLTDTKTAQI